MRRSIPLFGILGLLTMFFLASLGTTQQTPSGPDLENPIEIQPRSQIHEAFAQPFDGKPEPGPIVPKEPPAPIAEEPPDQRPEAENVQWIPGYWAWDAQKQDFVWISGVHRVPPQDRVYVPGYWQRSDDGWRWVQGFWADAKQQAIPYTPEPPAPLDIGPSMPAPGDNSMYVPGSWFYRDDRFVWRPGYYSPIQMGRVWIPPRFLWTPGGYIFVNGYWDCPFEDRGLAYASVYFRRPLWLDPGWRYRPSLVINLGGFWNSAFVRNGSFFYGNYYDPFYSRLGYSPWYAGRGRYDPIFSYYGWRNHRNNPNWIAGVQQTFASRSAGRIAPPTVAVTPLTQVTSTRLVPATATQLQTQKQFVADTRQRAVNRQQLDTAWANKGRSPGSTIDTRMLTNVVPPGATSPLTPSPKVVSSGGAVTSPLAPKTSKIDPRPDGGLPKSSPGTGPRVTTTNPPPRVTTTTPAPNVVPSNPPPVVAPSNPPPRVTTTTPAPKITAPSVPRVTTPTPSVPRATSPSPAPAPKITSPPPAPAPRVTSPPPAPAPRVTTLAPSAPRITSPPPSAAPRVTSPPPRVSSPAPAPRVSSPAPAARVTPSAPPRP